MCEKLCYLYLYIELISFHFKRFSAEFPAIDQHLYRMRYFLLRHRLHAALITQTKLMLKVSDAFIYLSNMQREALSLSVI